MTGISRWRSRGGGTTAGLRPAGGSTAGLRPAGLSTVGAALFALLMAGAAYTGFLQADDLAYATAAGRWLTEPPYLGHSHWEMRHPIVLPLAMVFGLAGRSEATLAAPMLAYAALLLALCWRATAWAAGPMAAALAILLIGALPAFALGASLVVTDVPEAALVLAAWFAFLRGRDGGPRWLFAAAGALAGCAFLARETSVALLAAYGAMFLRRPRPLSPYVLMGACFAAVLAVDVGFAWALSGDPLWRIHLSQAGVNGDSPLTPGLRSPAGTPDPLGIYQLPRLAQLALMLLASTGVGLVAHASLAGAAVGARAPGAGGVLARRMLVLGGAWLVVVGLGLRQLWVLPRYYLVVLVCLAVAGAIGLAALARRWPRVVAAGLGAVMASSLLLAALGDHGLMFGERALVAAAAARGETIRTDPGTLNGAAWLLEVAGLSGRVAAGAPVPGGLYFANAVPRRPARGWVPPALPAAAVVVARYAEAPAPLARMCRALGLDRVLPRRLWAKIDRAPRTAVLVRWPT